MGVEKSDELKTTDSSGAGDGCAVRFNGGPHQNEDESSESSPTACDKHDLHHDRRIYSRNGCGAAFVEYENWLAQEWPRIIVVDGKRRWGLGFRGLGHSGFGSQRVLLSFIRRLGPLPCCSRSVVYLNPERMPLPDSPCFSLAIPLNPF